MIYSEEILKLILKILIITIALPLFAHAESKIGNFFFYTQEPANVVLVEKNKTTLTVLNIKDNNFSEIKKNTVLIGQNGGDKIKQGDLRTPEGIYFIVGHYSPEYLKDMYGDFAKTYGTGAFPLDYPNPADRAESKTGGGIWLHGVDDNREENVTKGCVAMENKEFNTLMDKVETSTPVIITKEKILLEEESYLAEKRFYKDFFNGFIESWESNDFENYSSYFHINFKSGSKNYAQFLANKKNLMKIYPKRTVRGENLKVFVENQHSMAMQFDQFYCAPNLSVYGEKTLYFKKELDSQRIVAEKYKGKDESVYVNPIIINFLENWKITWEQMDMDSYSANYSTNMKGGLKEWMQDKVEKFSKYSTIKIGISNIQITKQAPNRYKVSFVQDFDGGFYKDRGLKTLILEGCPGDMKIYSEDWSAL